MLTVSGIVYISEPPIETQYQNGSWFKFTGIGKHPRKKDHLFYKVSIFVAKDSAMKARERLVEGKHIWIRTGDLTGTRYETGTVVNGVSATWDKIELLNLTLQSEKQENNK